MNRNRLCIAFAILIAFCLGAVLNSVFSIRAVQAQQQFTIPKSWGALKGSAATNLIFEDSAGTIRLVPIIHQLNSRRVEEIRRN